MNNRILSQRMAAWLKYRVKIRGCTSPRLRGFALSCLQIDYMRIDGKCCINYKEYRKMGKRW